VSYSPWDCKGDQHDLATKQPQSLCISHYAKWSVLFKPCHSPMSHYLYLFYRGVHRAVIWAHSQGHRAGKRGADMWMDAGTLLWSLCQFPQVIQMWDLRGDSLLTIFLKLVREATKSTETGVRRLTLKSWFCCVSILALGHWAHFSEFWFLYLWQIKRLPWMMSVSPSYSMDFFIQTETGWRIFNNYLNYSRFELNRNAYLWHQKTCSRKLCQLSKLETTHISISKVMYN